jgi:hypothetical protein
MKLSTVSVMSAIVIFAATLPHGVGAWLISHSPLQSTSIALKGHLTIDHKLLAKMIAKKKVNKMFRNPNREWKALSKLWGKESAWNWKAKNPHSSAYGIAQVLGTPKGSTIEYQVNKGLEYIVHRYDTPSKAWAFWLRNGWY